MGLSTSTLLRPVHAWFFVWEDVLPSLYRVVAVVSAAALTTLALRAFGIGPTWLVAIAATLAWIALAVAQEHDERVRVPVDQRFVDALRECLDPLMAGHGWTFGSATSGCRARKDTTTTVVYDHHGASHRMAWIIRNASAGTLDVRWIPDDVDAHPEVATQLIARGDADLAERLRRATDPEVGRAHRERCVRRRADRQARLNNSNGRPTPGGHHWGPSRVRSKARLDRAAQPQRLSPRSARWGR